LILGFLVAVADTFMYYCFYWVYYKRVCIS